MSPSLLPILAQPEPRSDLSTLVGGAASSSAAPAGGDFERYLRQAMGAGEGSGFAQPRSRSLAWLAAARPNWNYDSHSAALSTSRGAGSVEYPSQSVGVRAGSRDGASQSETHGLRAPQGSASEDSRAAGPEQRTGAGAAPEARTAASDSPQASSRANAGANEAQAARQTADPAAAESTTTAQSGGKAVSDGTAAGKTPAIQAVSGATEKAALPAQARKAVDELAAALGLSAKQKQALLREVAVASAKTLKQLVAEWNLVRTEAKTHAKGNVLALSAPSSPAKGDPAKKDAALAVQQAIHALLANLGFHIPAARTETPAAATAMLSAGAQELPLPPGGHGSIGVASAPGNASNNSTTTVVDLRGNSAPQTHTGGSGNQQPGPGSNSEGGSARLIQIVSADSLSSGAARGVTGTPPAPGGPSGTFQQQFQSIAGQLVRQTGILLKDSNAGEIRLLLKPENLGSVRIRIDMVDNNLTGKILVDNSQIAKLIQQNLDSLYQGFRQSGFTQTSLSVSVGGRHAGEREKGRHSPLPTLERVGAVGSLRDSVPTVDAFGGAYSFVNLVV